MLLKSLVEVFVILSSSTSFSKASAATAIRAPSDPSIFEFTDVFVREIEQDTFESALSRRVATVRTANCRTSELSSGGRADALLKTSFFSITPQTVTFDDLPQPVDINARYMPESYGGLSWSTSSAYIRSSAHIIASSSPPHALYAVVGPEADGTEVPVISGKGIRMISFNCASLEKKQYDGREGQLISVFGKASHQDVSHFRLCNQD